MTKTMRAILIDPYAMTIKEEETTGELAALYAAIQCELVERIAVNERDDLWIDEEGMLREGVPVFHIKGDSRATIIAGRALILGHEEAESAPAQIALEHVQRMVMFTSFETTGDMTEGGWNEDQSVYHCGVPILRPRRGGDGHA